MVKESPSVREMLQARRNRQDEQSASMYGHSGRGSIDEPRQSPRLSKEQRKEYAEELEYHHNTFGPVPVNPNQYAEPIGPHHPHADVNANQYAKPIGPQRPSALSRLASGVGATFREVGENPHIRQIASQSGFGGSQPAPNQQRGRRTPPQQRAPREPSGAPGQTIYLTTCNEFGECKQRRISGGAPRERRPRRPGYMAGTLGGDDPGFL